MIPWSFIGSGLTAATAGAAAAALMSGPASAPGAFCCAAATVILILLAAGAAEIVSETGAVIASGGGLGVWFAIIAGGVGLVGARDTTAIGTTAMGFETAALRDRLVRNEYQNASNALIASTTPSAVRIQPRPRLVC